MTTQIRLRRDIAANWTSVDPVLALGEPGIETDTRKIKYGDGSTAWNLLEYSASGEIGPAGPSGAPGVGVPVGGTAGQVLAKIDITDYNTEWVNQTGGGSTGNITFTGNTIGSSNNTVSISASNLVELNTGSTYMWTEASNASIQVGGSRWVFSDPTVAGGSSNLIEAPNGVYQRSGDTVVCDPSIDTVIYTSTYGYQYTLKLLLCIEGIVDGQTVEDTQSCEMVVAKSIRNDAVAGTVYGLVYTSALPLATLSARWNPITSLIEITCRPSSTINSVSVHSSVTELSSSRL